MNEKDEIVSGALVRSAICRPLVDFEKKILYSIVAQHGGVTLRTCF